MPPTWVLVTEGGGYRASLPLLRRRAEEEGALLTLKRKARGGDSRQPLVIVA